ncbi:MAG TPA: RNase H family protein, partial [Dehalococcoidia bacterium]|nr:RNase H family protein [Dehalococcoidia bacterium]
MEARRFQCEECGTGFTVPPEALEKFPNWRPKKCRACRRQSRPEVRADRARPAKTAPESFSRPASSTASAEIYAEGSCEPNPGDGGWAAVKVAGGRIVREASGFEPSTTNNRMELAALVEGLKMTAPEEEAVIWTASEFCFKTA